MPEIPEPRRLDWHGWTVYPCGMRCLVGPFIPDLDPTKVSTVFECDGRVLFQTVPNPRSVLPLVVP
jgi:hypothetical protein